VSARGPREVRVVLLDIEGTTTPIEFVHRTLFGYARENLRSFLEANQRNPAVRHCIGALKAQHHVDDSEKRTPPKWLAGDSEIASATEYGLWLIDSDSKVPPLKTLQGLIWQEGYRSGKLSGQVYPDIPRAFAGWRRQGKEISIYSSGSELAQRLLFATTQFGDLTPYIRNFFDTRVGAKTAADSYRRIASLTKRPEEQFLFLSDAIAELKAAQSVGFQTRLVLRGERNDSDRVVEEQTVVHDLESLIDE
jgi:enolase-phosphatase E1